MDNYVKVVMMLLVGGMAVSLLQSPPRWELFYASIGGIIIIFLYNSFKNRKEQQRLRRERRKSKK